MSGQGPGLAIADRSAVAKNALIRLLSEVKDKAADGQLTIQPANVEDLLDKFTLWAGSLGALHAPSKKLSLDYRLQDALDIRDQICHYLENLLEAIGDLRSIVSGDSPNHGIHEGSDSDEEPEDTEDEPTDEAQMILEVIDQCMRSLFRIAVLVRQASPQDRFQRALQHTELAFPDSFDVEHVEQKYTKLSQHGSRWLAKRLGSAIAKRRQFIKYCRDHKARLGVESVDNAEISVEVETKTEQLSSKATMFVKARYVDAELLQAKFEEGDDAVSLITASTAFDSETLLRLPSLTDLSPDGQAFECPICFTLQQFLREKAWKMHAFRDLKSYVCTFDDEKCKTELFEDRNSWFEHELQHHRSRYTCSLCREGAFASKSEITDHITSAHRSFSPDQMSMLLDSGRQVPVFFDAYECPFCDDWAETLQHQGDPSVKIVSGEKPSVLVSSTRFKRHVATHQEQLAIFAVPRSTEKIGSPSWGSVDSVLPNSVSSRVSDQPSLLSDVHPELEDQENDEIVAQELYDSVSRPLTEAALTAHATELPPGPPDVPPPTESYSSYESIESVKSQYPKKGKTQIPNRLVHTSAIKDLGYPYVEENDAVVIMKALGKENIDELLKLSRSYKKSEAGASGVDVPGPDPTAQFLPASDLKSLDSVAIRAEIHRLQRELDRRQIQELQRKPDVVTVKLESEDQSEGDKDLLGARKRHQKGTSAPGFMAHDLDKYHKPEQQERRSLWTEITKDLVEKEAIEKLGYDYEETEWFFYVMKYLEYEEVFELVELTNKIRGRSHNATDTQQGIVVGIDDGQDKSPQSNTGEDGDLSEKGKYPASSGA